MENHDRSDFIGEEILGSQPNAILKDEAASRINNFRTKVLMDKADIVMALFGEKYKQWNTAMDASSALSSKKPLIIIRPENLHHPLKELSSKADVTVETIDQAIAVLSYLFEQE
jgi:YtoQ family protein